MSDEKNKEKAIKKVLAHQSFPQRPSKIVAIKVFGNAFRVNVYAEEHSESAIRSHKMIFSDLVRVDAS